VKATRRTLLIACLSIAGIIALLVTGFFVWTRWQYHLPTDQSVREYFQDHRAEFIRFAELLEKDPVPKRIAPNGVVELLVPPALPCPRVSMTRIGFKAFVIVTLKSLECIPITAFPAGLRTPELVCGPIVLI
jgi:hypothetical protein